MDWKYLFFNFDGRIDRRQWWVGAVILFVVSIVVSLLFGDGGLIGAIINVLMVVAGLSLHVKRFHDRGKSGWWVLVFLIPVIGFIWMIVEMGFLEGDPGPNEYGPPAGGERLAFGAAAARTPLRGGSAGLRDRDVSSGRHDRHDGGPSDSRSD